MTMGIVLIKVLHNNFDVLMTIAVQVFVFPFEMVCTCLVSCSKRPTIMGKVKKEKNNNDDDKVIVYS